LRRAVTAKRSTCSVLRRRLAICRGSLGTRQLTEEHTNITPPEGGRDTITQTAIVILGTHRSGTSALARVINLLGADLPEDLMVAGEGNEIGHWESQSVADFNDELLASAGSRWNDWLPFSNSWNQSVAYPSFVARARDLLKAEYGGSPLFVLKDPRICRLAGFWLQVIESLDIRPVIVLPQRNPIEVSASLAARDGSQVGFGLLLWLRHVLDAEVATRGKSRCFVSYEQLLADWTGVAAEIENSASFAFPRRSVLADEEIASFLLDDARHQRETSTVATSTSTPIWVRETYAIMQRWCKVGETADDRVRLDQIRSAFDTAAPSFAQLASKGMSIGDGVGSASIARRELEATRTEFDEFQERSRHTIGELENSLLRHQDVATQAQSEADQHRASEAQLRTELDKIVGRTVELENSLLHQQDVSTQAQSEADQHRASEAQLRTELDKILGRTVELETALLHQQDVTTQAQSEADGHRASEAQLRTELDKIHGRTVELEAALLHQQDVTTQAEAEADARRASEAQLRTELDKMLARTVELETAFLRQQGIATEAQALTDALQDSQDRLKAELEKAGHRAMELESALIQRQEEAAQAWAQAEEHRLTGERAAAALEHSSDQNKLLGEAVADARGRLDAVSEECTAAEIKAQRIRHVAEGLAQRLSDAQSSIRALEDELAQQRARSMLHAERTESAAQAMEARFAGHQREILRLQTDLSEAADRGKISDGRTDWLRAVAELLMKKPVWWALLSTKTRLSLEGRMIKRSGLFDGEAYLERNPDVRAAGIDPLVHYLRHGIDEGRSW
jgi:hypothetical protein